MPSPHQQIVKYGAPPVSWPIFHLPAPGAIAPALFARGDLFHPIAVAARPLFERRRQFATPCAAPPIAPADFRVRFPQSCARIRRNTDKGFDAAVRPAKPPGGRRPNAASRRQMLRYSIL